MNTSVTSDKPRWVTPPQVPFSKLSMSCIQLTTDLAHNYTGGGIIIEDIKENRTRGARVVTSELKEDCYVGFPNYDFYLRRQVLKSDFVNDLKEKLLAINRWCFLNVGPQDYGFYSPDIYSRGTGDYIRIVDFGDYVDVYACVVFKHSADLLAFKLKF